ncbi:unnamed protein product [Moneuplotes crassus]|uniref:Uncharacterized protein n=1 Tax=Euplotes crassus TaxID=5936 RepID=A0AAD1U564_EUPCR|nr:unnamed protein product [Moneuplotes crassus]
MYQLMHLFKHRYPNFDIHGRCHKTKFCHFQEILVPLCLDLPISFFCPKICTKDSLFLAEIKPASWEFTPYCLGWW